MNATRSSQPLGRTLVADRNDHIICDVTPLEVEAIIAAIEESHGEAAIKGRRLMMCWVLCTGYSLPTSILLKSLLSTSHLLNYSLKDANSGIGSDAATPDALSSSFTGTRDLSLLGNYKTCMNSLSVPYFHSIHGNNHIQQSNQESITTSDHNPPHEPNQPV